MKKLVTIIMAVVLMIPLAACGETKKPTEEISDSTEVTTENSTTEKSETEGNTTVENGKNISVLFFSVTVQPSGMGGMIYACIRICPPHS